MGLLDCVGEVAFWNGYDCCKNNGVKDFTPLTPGVYSAKVVDDDGEFNVELNIIRTRQSKCNCPQAYGKKTVCKHMIAVYLTVFPKYMKKLYKETEAYEKEERIRQEKIKRRVAQYVHKMKKAELEEAMCNILFTGSDQQLGDFLRGRIDVRDLYKKG